MDTVVDIVEIGKRDAQTNVAARPYDLRSEFYLEDNRKARQNNPITKGVLEAKYGVLLPPWFVKGKSVLDLGSCLGAAGQWCLFYGAKSYTGVELQGEYLEKSTALLANWGDRARIVKSDIRSFLGRAASHSYDMVIATGVLYLFVDPETVVAEICRVATESVAIESNYPGLFRRIKNHDVLLTQYVPSQDVNMADGNYSLSGPGATPSPKAFDLFFKLCGFANKEGLLPFPISPETVVYTPFALAANLPARFAARYVRSAEANSLQSLEQDLQGEGQGEKKSWETHPKYAGVVEKFKETGQLIATVYPKWEFNAAVADSFEKIAESSIPHYRQVIDKSIEIIKRRNFENPRIIDVGSAVGATLEKLYHEGFKDIYGVDNSKPMLERSFKHATLIHSDTFPVSSGPFDAVIANWVLHFIDDRETYLRSIRDSLKPCGMLIVTDKIAHSALARSLYHDFKRRNGLTDEEIDKKEKQLIGVLTPYPLTWYLDLFEELGFKTVDVVDAHYAFTTLVAQL